jgi:hypothetical protein
MGERRREGERETGDGREKKIERDRRENLRERQEMGERRREGERETGDGREKKRERDRRGGNLSLRLHYGESLKQYRNTLRKKKEQHVRNQLNAIEESIYSNHFWENWKTLNKQQHVELSIQNGDVWVNHFSNLFVSITKNKQQKHIHDQIHSLESTIKDDQNPLDSPITLNELQDKIQTLQPKKDCGVDGLLNKFQLVTLKLFNIILSSGIFPNIWNQGLITPIHKSGDTFDPNNYQGISVSSIPYDRPRIHPARPANKPKQRQSFLMLC